MAAMAPGAAPKIQIPRWIQLVGLPVLLILAWVVAGRVFHVVFLFLVASLIALVFSPDRAGDQLRATRAVPDPSRPRRRDGVFELRGGVDREHLGSRHRRRRSDEDGRKQGRHLLYGAPWTDRPDRRRPRRRPAAALAGHPWARLDQDPGAWPPLGAADPRQGRRQVHPQGRQLRRGSGDLDREAALLRDRDPRRVDLHAARLFPLSEGDRQAIPTASRLGAAARADGTRRRRLREGPDARLADHRRQRGRGDVVTRGARVGARRRQVRTPLRRRGGGDRVDPVPRPVARSDPGRDLRRGRPPDLRSSG